VGKRPQEGREMRETTRNDQRKTRDQSPGQRRFRRKPANHEITLWQTSNPKVSSGCDPALMVPLHLKMPNRSRIEIRQNSDRSPSSTCPGRPPDFKDARYYEPLARNRTSCLHRCRECAAEGTSQDDTFTQAEHRFALRQHSPSLLVSAPSCQGFRRVWGCGEGVKTEHRRAP
jgi:hypothetical protein